MFLIALVTLGLLAGAWLVLVSPERKQASKLQAQVSSAQQQLQAARAKEASAELARRQYPGAYATVVRLGKAIPASSDEASLVYQLNQLASVKRTELVSVDAAGGASGQAASSPTTSAASGATTSTYSGKEYSIVFQGNYFQLYNLLDGLDSFTFDQGNGQLNVSGRLVTINSVNLALVAGGGLSGTLDVTSYSLPPGQSVTGAATATTPAAGAPAAPTAAATSASPPAAPSSPAPALVRVTPVLP